MAAHAGGSVGGALKKDKLFYFANFDYINRNFPGQNRIVNTGFDGSQRQHISPRRLHRHPGAVRRRHRFLQKQMNVVVPRTYNPNWGSCKIDWRPSDRNTFSFASNAMRWVRPTVSRRRPC